MGDVSAGSQPIVSATEPRRWIAAIVGGVVLGEALWSMLQILVRDWAAPALTKAMGQEPTKNPGAFDPLPLVIAFVEACAAAIILVLLMAWAQRRVRVVVRTVTAPAAVQVVAPAAVAVPAVVAVGATPVARAVQTEPRVVPAPVAPAAPAAPVVTTQVTAPRPAAPIPSATPPAVPRSVAAAPVASTSVASTSVPSTAAPPAAVQTPPKAAPAAPKKPKTIYYNSVGEPIEE